MKRINVGIIGTGWCGGIRARTCANNTLVDELHIAEIDPGRLDKVARESGAKTATTNHTELLANDGIDAFIISATPETTHFPMARDCLKAGKHVFLEKPLALTLKEADELIDLANGDNLKFTIGYSQRFNPKFAYVKKSFADGVLGEPVSALVSRNISRNLGNKIGGRIKLSPAAMEATHDLDFKIGGRIKLSPAAMEATHDLDFVLCCLEPAKPIRVYA